MNRFQKFKENFNGIDIEAIGNILNCILEFLTTVIK